MAEQKAYFAGAGIGSLSGAVFMIRDGHMKPQNITIFETLGISGGSCDGIGTSKGGYVIRGGRMLNFPAYECLWDLMKFIPSIDNPGKTLYDETIEFNEVYKTHSNSRIITHDRQKVDVTEMGFTMEDRMDLLKLTNASEEELGNTRICEWFRPEFFRTKFWLMWVTTFAFQPWHSACELKRYMRRFMHEFPRIHTLEGVARTVYNQYDSLVVPVQKWLEEQGVNFVYDTKVVDVDVKIEGEKKTVTSMTLLQGGKQSKVSVRPKDIVILQNGSMTDASSIGSMTEPAQLFGEEHATSWSIWEKLSKLSSDFGNPEPFKRCVSESVWQSFTVTINDDTSFFDQEIEWSKNQPGTGALVTFADSNWFMSIVIPRQPHFRNQPENSQVFWGYGLIPDRVGNFVNKRMIDCTGAEILQELIGHLRFDKSTIKNANCIPCILPYITAQFMTRNVTDRPCPVPKGCVNLGFTSQFVEIPNDVVFTVEYSVRAAQMAVYQLMNIKDKKIPKVSRHDKKISTMIKSVKKAFKGSVYASVFNTLCIGGLATGLGFAAKYGYEYYKAHY